MVIMLYEMRIMIASEITSIELYIVVLIAMLLRSEFMGYFRKTYNHSPGPCRKVPGIGKYSLDK